MRNRVAPAQSQRGTALTALVIGLATALYGASGAFGAVGAALNQVWRVEEGRGFVSHKLHNLVWTIVLLALALVTTVLLFLGGGIADDLLGKSVSATRSPRSGSTRAGRPRCSRPC